MKSDNIKNKYLVTMDGCKTYGSYVDFVGLFETRKEAEHAIDEVLKYANTMHIDIKKDDYEIFEVDEGWWHYPHVDEFGRTVHTDIPLGGHEE